MNKRTKQILAATATLLLLVILQSISFPTSTEKNATVSAWQPVTKTSRPADTHTSSARDRDANDLDPRARPTR